jgi:hypothetical protein
MEFTLPGDQEYGNRVGLASRISVKISRVLILLDQQRADELGHSSTTSPKEEVKTRIIGNSSGKQRRGGAVTRCYLTLP